MNTTSDTDFPVLNAVEARVLGCLIEKKDYEGFSSRPASWEFIIDKFNTLAAPVDESLRREIIAVVQDLENYSIRELMALLGKVSESCEICA